LTGGLLLEGHLAVASVYIGKQEKEGTTEGFLLVDMASLHFWSSKVQYNKLHLVQSTLHSKHGLYNKVLVTKLLCTNTLYHHDVVPPF